MQNEITEADCNAHLSAHGRSIVDPIFLHLLSNYGQRHLAVFAVLQYVLNQQLLIDLTTEVRVRIDFNRAIDVGESFLEVARVNVERTKVRGRFVLARFQ